MIKTVICTDCGKKFVLEDTDGVYNPSDCPQCGKNILLVKTTPTSSELIAQVEE